MFILRAACLQMFLIIVLHEGMGMSRPWAHIAAFLGSLTLNLYSTKATNQPKEHMQ